MKLGKYNIEKTVFSNHQVTMYLAADSAKNERVMLRVLTTKDESIRDKWYDVYENYQLIISNFKYLPRVLSIDSTEDQVFTVFNTGQGKMLETFNQLSMSQIMELLDAVHHLHNKGIAHGALEPCNIWINSNGHITLFGAGEGKIKNKRSTKLNDVTQLKQLLATCTNLDIDQNNLDSTTFEDIDELNSWISGQVKPGLVEKKSHAINPPESVVKKKTEPVTVKENEPKPREQTNKTSNPSAVDNPYPSLENEEELNMFVGKNITYYFKKWKNPKKKLWGIDVNWAAFFCSYYWLAYRKLYGYAFGVWGFFTLLTIAGQLIAGRSSFLSLLSFILACLIGLWANTFYYKHASKKIIEIKQLHKDPRIQKNEITKAGGTSWGGVGTLIFLSIVSVIASVFAANVKTINAASVTKPAVAETANSQKPSSNSDIKNYIMQVSPIISDTKSDIAAWNDFENSVQTGNTVDYVSELNSVKNELNNLENKADSISVSTNVSELSSLNNELKGSILNFSNGAAAQSQTSSPEQGNALLKKANDGLADYSAKIKDFLSSHNEQDLFTSELSENLPLPGIELKAQSSPPVNDSGISKLMTDYLSDGVKAINENDFSVVKQDIIEGSKMYSESQNFIANLYRQGITEELVNQDIVSIQPDNTPNTYKVKINATFNINNNNSEKVMEESDEYTVFDDGTKLGISDVKVISTKTDSQTSNANNDSWGSNTSILPNANDAAQTLQTHYTDISNGDYVDAYNLMSSAMRAKYSLDNWSKGLKNNKENDISISNVSISSDNTSAVVTFSLTSYDNQADGKTLVQNWGGTWSLVIENGQWRLDTPNIKKLDSYEQ